MIGTLTTSIARINLQTPSPSSSRSNSFHKSSVNVVLTVTAMRPGSLYQVLRIDKNATITEIKTAYRILVKIYNPDVYDYAQNGVGDGDFIEIHDVYATLSDPVARELYGMKGRRKLTVVRKRPKVYTCRRWETNAGRLLN